ncbi:MAG: TlpA family protein disulfide reductase [Candidatus Kapaibacteriota bacterium]|jgi:thiol-disulfide isomerase/thioredoxin
MRKILILITTLLIISSVYAKENKTIPNVKVKNLRNEIVETKTFNNDGKPFVINFWATWCKPCIMELNNIHEVYDKWQKETGVKIIAVSIDDARNSKKVVPFVKGRNWKFEIYLDENGDFRRAMNVNNPPHSFLVNSKGEIVWEHNGYATGDEEFLYQRILKLLEEEKSESQKSENQNK